MKRVPLYFNKGVILLVSLAVQMETFAQQGRFIPQDWGASDNDGDGYRAGSVGDSDLWDD